MKLAYLDASAVVKLFKDERETPALARALEDWSVWTSSDVVAVEARCTARRLGDAATVAAAEQVLRRLELVVWSAVIRDRAGEPFQPPLRALDAIHAATAVGLGGDLGRAFVYDADLADALMAEGIEVASPGAA